MVFPILVQKYEIAIRFGLLSVAFYMLPESNRVWAADRHCALHLMDIEAYRKYCLKKKGVTEALSFDKNTLVYKVRGKMFVLAGIDPFESITLKCDPATAIQLRAVYAEVTPGYYMNKKHWNTVRLDGSIHDNLIYRWIDDSYRLVVDKLPRADQAWLEQEGQE